MPFLKIENSLVLFIHIPKTGGTSMEKWMRLIGPLNFFSPMIPSAMKITPQHFSIADIKVLLNPLVNWDYSFAVVRDPYERMESEFFFRTEDIVKQFGDRPEFSDWFIQQINLYNNNAFHADNHFRPQSEFVDDSVDVFKLENGLNKIADYLIHEFSLKINTYPEKNNMSNRDTDAIFWSNEAIAIANKVYSTDFDLFGYTKKLPAVRMAS